ncbi:mitotic spindle assembly checkpoint protein MAD2B isoform X1 [Latimeria chalumnae]|uniref:mitotic spindle assembly checkpoint protein MAD2B isoform X1 n=3 Tax=Latimeria chalumnae TaxID=7897 RepID=UPI00313CDEA1
MDKGMEERKNHQWRKPLGTPRSKVNSEQLHRGPRQDKCHGPQVENHCPMLRLYEFSEIICSSLFTGHPTNCGLHFLDEKDSSFIAFSEDTENQLDKKVSKMATLTRQDLNFGQVVADILCEFLEVAVHLILYVREVYPIGIFQKRKKYNVPVQMSCHPELNQYIQDTLHCIKPLIEKNDAEKVVVVIMDKEHHPVERFVFEISQPPLLSISSESLLSHMEQLLRAFLLKISVCDAILDSNPPGCTFTVLVHTRESATRNMEKIQVIKDFPWIIADEQEVHMQDPRLIPLKSMTSDILKMQLYVEERVQKTS